MHPWPWIERLNGPASQARMFARLEGAPNIKRAARLLWHHAERNWHAFTGNT